MLLRGVDGMRKKFAGEIDVQIGRFATGKSETHVANPFLLTME